MKNQLLESAVPAKLSQGRKHFEKWRSSHKPRTRLPADLWSLATELAHEYGVSKTARILRLDYYRLRKRSESYVPVDIGQEPPADRQHAGFLELPPVQRNPGIECVIECQDGAGSTIRIQLKGQDFDGLASVCGQLWRHHP